MMKSNAVRDNIRLREENDEIKKKLASYDAKDAQFQWQVALLAEQAEKDLNDGTEPMTRGSTEDGEETGNDSETSLD